MVTPVDRRRCRDCQAPLVKKPGRGRWPVRCIPCRRTRPRRRKLRADKPERRIEVPRRSEWMPVQERIVLILRSLSWEPDSIVVALADALSAPTDRITAALDTLDARGLVRFSGHHAHVTPEGIAHVFVDRTEEHHVGRAAEETPAGRRLNA